MTRFLLILTFSYLKVLVSCRQTESRKENIILTVDFDYLEGCESGKGECKPLTIERNSKQDSVALVFTNGGTQTEVHLFTDSSYSKMINGTYQSEIKPLRYDHKRVHEGKPTLNLTGLPDGKYRTRMLACELGGSFELNLITKKK